MNKPKEPTAQEIDARLRKLLSKAYDAGFEHAMKKMDKEEYGEDVQVKRIVITKWGLLAFLIIVFGSVFSLGVYMGRMYG